MTAIDPLTLAETLNNPQSIAEALEALLRAENAQFDNLLSQAETTKQEIEDTLSAGETAKQEIERLLTSIPISNSSTTNRGMIQLATEAETNAGNNAEKAITPATLKETFKFISLNTATENGYLKIPSGLILQWTYSNLRRHPADFTTLWHTKTIVWAIAFPVKCFFADISIGTHLSVGTIDNISKTGAVALIKSGNYAYVPSFRTFAFGY